MTPTVPYAPYPKYGPDVLGKAEYDRQMTAWKAYQDALRQQKGGNGPDRDPEDDESPDEREGESEDEHDEQEEGESEMYTYVAKYRLPGQTRRRAYRKQGIEATSKAEARRRGREAMEDDLQGPEGEAFDRLRGSEKVVKPRGKPFQPGEDPRRDEDGPQGGEGSGDESGGNGEGNGEGEGGGDDDTPRMPSCPECGAPRGSTEGCCKPKDPGGPPAPPREPNPDFNLSIMRTDDRPLQGVDAENRLRSAAHPEIVDVLSNSLQDVDAWTRQLVQHEVQGMGEELYDAMAKSHTALVEKIHKATANGKGSGGNGKPAGMTKKQIRKLIHDHMDMDKLAENVAERIGAPKRIVVETNGTDVEVSGTPHKQFERSLKAVKRGLNLFLVGPAGSGKGYLAQHIAEAMGHRFGFVSCSEGMSEGMLLGRGVPLAEEFLYLRSSFVDFYENGGVFMLDEVDAANPNVLLIINECLSSPHLAIPNRTEKPYAERHPDFIPIVAANTWGTGPNMEYVGRNRLDAAFLDRFAGARIELDYDANVEANIAKAYLGADKAESVLRTFWGVRKKLHDLNIRRIWSTRGLEKMCIALADGDTMDEVLQAHTAGWTEDEKQKAEVTS